MKLLSIVSAAYGGGATYSVLNTLLGLKKKGLNLLVITPEKGFLTDELDKYGIPWRIAPIIFSVWPQHKSFLDYIKFIPKALLWLFKYYKGYLMIDKIIKEWHPNLIHTNVSVIDIGYTLAKKNKLPHLWHIREYGDLDFDLKYFPSRKKYLKKLNESYTIAITKDLKKYLKLSNKCKVIYNGIEQRNSSVSVDYVSKKIIFVGRLSANKGVEMILNAFKESASKNDFVLEYWGICLPTYERKINKQIKKYNLKDRVFLRGATTNIYDVMRNSKAIIVASRNEGFGRITAEAMLNDCLVIGRNTGGTKEQLDNGLKMSGHEIGLRFLDNRELSERINSVKYMSLDEYKTLVSSAKKTVMDLYSVDKNVNQTYNFIMEIMNIKNETDSVQN